VCGAPGSRRPFEASLTVLREGAGPSKRVRGEDHQAGTKSPVTPISRSAIAIATEERARRS
jgi:hypothetical protein